MIHVTGARPALTANQGGRKCRGRPALEGPSQGGGAKCRGAPTAWETASGFGAFLRVRCASRSRKHNPRKQHRCAGQQKGSGAAPLGPTRAYLWPAQRVYWLSVVRPGRRAVNEMQAPFLVTQPDAPCQPEGICLRLLAWGGIIGPMPSHQTTGTVKLFQSSGLFAVSHRPTPSGRTYTVSPTDSSGCGLPTAC